MIAHLHGEAVLTGDRWVVIDVGGIGYQVQVTQPELQKISTSQATITYLYRLMMKSESLLNIGKSPKTGRDGCPWDVPSGTCLGSICFSIQFHSRVDDSFYVDRGPARLGEPGLPLRVDPGGVVGGEYLHAARELGLQELLRVLQHFDFLD